MTTAVGKVSAVISQPSGSPLVDSALLGDTTLAVMDAYDFNETGGQIALADGSTLTYTAADQEGDILTLSAPLAADLWVQGAANGDNDYFIYVYPFSSDIKAVIDFDDGDEGVLAIVPLQLQAYFEEGVRAAGTAEMASVSDDSGEWTVVEVADQLKILPSAFSEPPSAMTDGEPPATSPPATVRGGVNALFVSWDPAANIDPVTYKIHVSTVDGFLPDGTTLAGESKGGSMFVIHNLPDGTPLDYNDIYFVRIIAADTDGEAPPGNQGAGTPVQINHEDIAVDAVTAANILAGEVTADKLAAVIALLSELYVGDHISITPDNGIRIELNNGGHIYLPSDGSPADFMRVVVQATELTVENNMTINGPSNKIAGGLALNQGIPSPSLAPSVASVPDPTPVAVSGGVAAEATLGNSVSAGKWLIAKFTGWTLAVAAVGGGSNNYKWTANIGKYTVDKVTGAKTLVGTETFLIYNWNMFPETPATPPTPTITGGYLTDNTTALIVSHPAYTHTNDVGGNTVEAAAKKAYVRSASPGTPYAAINLSALLITGSWNNLAAFTDDVSVWIAGVRTSDNKLLVYKYPVAFTTQSTELTSAETYAGVHISGLFIGAADFGSSRFVAQTSTGQHLVYNGATKEPTKEWTGPEAAKGLVWDGARFRMYGGSNKIWRFSTIITDAARSSTYSWFNATSGTESIASPPDATPQTRRAWLRITAQPIPSGSGTSFPDSVRQYVANQRQAALGVGVLSATYEVPTTGGAAAPAVDGFLALGNSGSVSSAASDANGPLILLKGDGSYRLSPDFHGDGSAAPGNVLRFGKYAICWGDVNTAGATATGAFWQCGTTNFPTGLFAGNPVIFLQAHANTTITFTTLIKTWSTAGFTCALAWGDGSAHSSPPTTWYVAIGLAA